MSRHYVVIRQRMILGEGEGMEEVLRKLEHTRADLYAKLRAIDWQPVIRQLLREALEQVRDRLGCELRDRFITPRDAEVTGMPRGECVGVLVKSGGNFGRVQVGIVYDGSKPRVFSLADDERGSDAHIAELQHALDHAYQERSIHAALRIIGCGPVERTEGDDGTVILQTELGKEKVGT